MKVLSGFTIAIMIALALAIFATTPPRPLGQDVSPDMFSAVRAMDDVSVIASRPHPAGSAENAKVREYIAGRMRELEMEVSFNSGKAREAATKGLNKWSGRDDPPVTITNVIGVLPGKDRTLPAVALMAHYDTVWGSPGAADDTAGVASSLEIARAIRATGQPPRDLILLFTDGEEIGLEGATKFFADHPMRKRLGAVINLEARGGGGRTLLFQTSNDNGKAVQLYGNSVDRPRASSLAAYIYSVLPNDTDLTPALQTSVIAYNFAFIGRSGLYHSPKATPENLDQGALQDMGAQVLGLTRALLDAPKLPEPAPDVVFADVFGLMLLIYPTWLGWGMLAVSGLSLAVLVRHEPEFKDMGYGALRLTGFLILSACLVFGLNIASGSAAAWSNGYDRLAAIPMLEAMTLLGLTGAALLVFGRGIGSTSAWVGATLTLFSIGLAIQIVAPTAAYIIILPVMVTVLAQLLPWRAVRVVVAGLVLGDALILGHLLMQSVGPNMPMVAALPAGVAAIALLPIWNNLKDNRAWIAAAAMLVGALAVALWVRFDPIADTVAVHSKGNG